MRRAIATVVGGCCAGLLLWLAFQLAEPLGLWDSRRGSGILGMLWASPIAAVSLLAVARAVGGAPLGQRLPILVLAIGTLGMWLASWAPESKFLCYPLADTCFARGFDADRFRELRPGMSPEEVLELAGPPLFKREGWWGYQLKGSPSTIWSYSRDNALGLPTMPGRPSRLAFAMGASSRCRESGVTIEVRRPVPGNPIVVQFRHVQRPRARHVLSELLG